MQRRLVVDARLVGKRGIGRYTFGLYAALLAMGGNFEYVFISGRGQAATELKRLGAQIVETDIPYYSIREQLELPRLVHKLAPALYHTPHFLLPTLIRGPKVATVHDASYLAPNSDLAHQGLVARTYYRWAFLNGARGADHILTDSEFSRTELIAYLHLDPSRITPIPLGVDARFRPATLAEMNDVRRVLNLPEVYFLHVGIQRHRKNARGAVLALAELTMSLGDKAHLVLAGPRDPRYEADLRSLVSGLNLEKRVHFLGEVADENLNGLYTSAVALVFPSFHEGFGFTVLEAMACGTAVIASNTTSIPEVAGDAALLVDPNDTEAIAAAMGRVWSSGVEREQLIARGFQRASLFTWSATARATLRRFELMVA